jgi:outer membrane protein assembly factor BamB
LIARLAMLVRCKAATLIAVSVLLAACTSVEKAKPTDLGVNVALLGVKSVWANDVGQIDFPLEVRVVGFNIFLASSNGTVVAIDARTGGDVWRTKLGSDLSAGVGSDGKHTAVVSRENEVIALDAGREIWRQKLNAVTLTAPLVAGARVFVLSADRSITAFDAATGRRLWQQQRNGEPLVLGQAGVMIAVNDSIIVGVGGRLQGLSPQNGNIRWDVPIANSRGTNEIERLVDLVSGASRVGDDVCVRSFQSSVACANVVKGSLLWSKSAIGSSGLGGDSGAIYGSEADGRIVAWRRSDGERLWASERLRFRKLTTPVLAGRSLVVGDDGGVLHFFSSDDGSPLNRISTDSTPIAAAPVLVGQTLVAVTRRGGVFGFRPE